MKMWTVPLPEDFLRKIKMEYEVENDTQFTNLIAVTLQKHPDWFPAAIDGLTKGFSECLAIANMKRAEAERPSLILGTLIPGKGIFAGLWEPKGRDGHALGKKFNVFAAPTDLTDSSGRKAVLTYNNAVKELGQLRNWHGHDGGTFKNDAALYEALKSGTVPDQWFIPPRDLLHGKDVDGNAVRTGHLYDLKNTGDFKGTFVPTAGGDNFPDYPSYYWSCTEHRGTRTSVCVVRFPDGRGGWGLRDYTRLSSRPCRVELAL